MDLHDVLIVGGGPAGLIAGAEAARSGADVLIVEEDPEIGEPDHCAGFVSARGLEKVIEPSQNFVLSWIKGARIFSPAGKAYEVMAEENKACVIDRVKFDKELLRRAKACGAEVVTGKAYSRELETKVLIDAEGTKGRLAKSLGFEVPKSIPAAQMDLEVADFERDVVELHIGECAPGFFAWKVPRGDHVRVGLACYQGVPLDLLKSMLERKSYLNLKNAKIIRQLFGKVVIGGPLRRTVRGNTMVIGDAGGFVKPTTGGGVVMGGLTAKLAGVAAAQAALSGAPLNAFEKAWKSKYGHDFRTMKLATRIFRNMKAHELEHALKVSHEAGILGLLAGYDLDLQGAAVNRVLESRLIRFAMLPFLRSLF
jgi:digeranylgeranylglycerophospholipid reductase